MQIPASKLTSDSSSPTPTQINMAKPTHLLIPIPSALLRQRARLLIQLQTHHLRDVPRCRAGHAFDPKMGTIHRAGTAGIQFCFWGIRALVQDIRTFVFAGGVSAVITVSGSLSGHY